MLYKYVYKVGKLKVRVRILLVSLFSHGAISSRTTSYPLSKATTSSIKNQESRDPNLEQLENIPINNKQQWDGAQLV